MHEVSFSGINEEKILTGYEAAFIKKSLKAQCISPTATFRSHKPDQGARDPDIDFQPATP